MFGNALRRVFCCVVAELWYTRGMNEALTITTLSGYDPIELSIGASRLLNTDATEHELAHLINTELERGILVAFFQRLSDGRYGYYVRMAEL